MPLAAGGGHGRVLNGQAGCDLGVLGSRIDDQFGLGYRRDFRGRRERPAREVRGPFDGSQGLVAIWLPGLQAGLGLEAREIAQRGCGPHHRVRAIVADQGAQSRAIDRQSAPALPVAIEPKPGLACLFVVHETDALGLTGGPAASRPNVLAGQIARIDGHGRAVALPEALGRLGRRSARDQGLAEDPRYTGPRPTAPGARKRRMNRLQSLC